VDRVRIPSLSQEFLDVLEHFILPVDETMVVGIGECDDNAIWDLFTEALDLGVFQFINAAKVEFDFGTAGIRQLS
jgi:hypothetical protein